MAIKSHKGAWICNKSSHRWMKIAGTRHLNGDWFYTENQAVIDQAKSADNVWRVQKKEPKKVRDARKMNKKRGKLKRKEEKTKDVKIHCKLAEEKYTQRIKSMKKRGEVAKDAQEEKDFYVKPHKRYQDRYCKKKGCKKICVLNPDPDLHPKTVDDVAKQVMEEIEEGIR